MRHFLHFQNCPDDRLVCLSGLLALPKTSQQLTSLQLLESIKSPGSLILSDEVKADLLVSYLQGSDPGIKVKRSTQHVEETKAESTKEMHFNSPSIISLHSLWQSRDEQPRWMHREAKINCKFLKLLPTNPGFPTFTMHINHYLHLFRVPPCPKVPNNEAEGFELIQHLLYKGVLNCKQLQKPRQNKYLFSPWRKTWVGETKGYYTFR